MSGSRKASRDGMDYYQNYDLVFNWLSKAFRNQTLEVLGIKTGKIRRVCSYRSAEISASAGVLDVVFVSAAQEWRDDITDIVLASGRPYAGRKEIRTLSGKYAPVIIDLTERDGPGRFEEIREALNKGDLSVLTELVFLPLYGKGEKTQFVKNVLRFEIDLYKKGGMPISLVAATLVMANKQIDRSFFNELWEEINMLNVLKFAHEKGLEEGRLKTAREMVLRFLEESVGVVPAYLSDEIMSISRPDILTRLVKQAATCKEIEEFEKMLRLANREPQVE